MINTDRMTKMVYDVNPFTLKEEVTIDSRTCPLRRGEDCFMYGTSCNFKDAMNCRDYREWKVRGVKVE